MTARRWLVVAAVIALAAVLTAVALSGGDEGNVRSPVADGIPAKGKAAIGTYGCGTCHTIPGIDGADGLVGPPLIKWSQRTYIAGNLTNSPENLIRWIMNPQQVEPGTAMPNLGVTEADARDIAAYLLTIE